ncbi:MAG: lactate utilization protein [Dehalobacterium sp.]|jgi:hypothetical protein
MENQQWHRKALGERVVQALIKNEFDAVYVATREEAIKEVLKFITAEISVGIGGSATIAGLGIPEKAAALGAKVLNHNIPGLSAEEKMKIRRAQLICDVFLCSSNALTLDGHLVNVDGVGNRVAAMTFGPKKIVIVAGTNKICVDEQAALERIEMIAAPTNNKRLNHPNPCTETGICSNCRTKTRTCRIYSVLRKKPLLSDITVLLVGEDLGY